MSKNDIDESSTLQVISRAGLPLLFTWLLISLSFVIPLLDSTKTHSVNLTDWLAEIAYLLAMSGGKFGAPVLGVILLVILISREGLGVRRKWTESVIFLIVSIVLVGGGAAVNEHVVKGEFKVPRPNIVWLAGDNGAGPLGMTANDFYQTGDKQSRREPLLSVLNQQPAPVLLSESIKTHWVEETGYSFPSGHAFSAMFFASFFLLLAVTYIKTNRIWFFYALLPWALFTDNFKSAYTC